jgi:hypothetical protein
MIQYGSSLRDLIFKRDFVRKRISSTDPTGHNRDNIQIPTGEKVSIAVVPGPGCVSHIWFTVSCKDRLWPIKTVLRIFWDDNGSPSVESPLGDFFGVGHGKVNHYASLPLNMVTGSQVLESNAAAMNCFFPMPFLSGARFEIENQCEEDIQAFYFYVDYELHDKLGEDIRYFHAEWRNEFPTRGQMPPSQEPSVRIMDGLANTDGKENYVIADIQGEGQYVGTVLSIDFIDPVKNFGWFGEGDDWFFIDGENTPSLHGTGTEDYFAAAWGFPSGEYSFPYHGVSLGKDTRRFSGKWTMYRFHIEDPVPFKKSLLVSIEHGHANCHSNNYSSVAYWYQKMPFQKAYVLPEVSHRIPLSEEDSMRRFWNRF